MRSVVRQEDGHLSALEFAEAGVCVGRLRGEELPAIVTDLLAQGLDTPALRELAGLSSPPLGEARPIFERAMRELGRAPPTPRTAYERLLSSVLERVASGRSAPRAGAEEICQLARYLRGEGKLAVFTGFASEWDDHPEMRQEIEAEMRAEARVALQRFDEPPA